MQIKDYNSSINQRIKAKFVQREVLACFTREMSELLNLSYGNATNNLPKYEDINNFYLDPEKYYKDYDYDTPEEMRDDGRNWQEIYEWWIISNCLANKLREKDESILEWGNHYYWGRTTTGHAILLDNVISEICSEMEILEGQKYEWKE